MSRSQQPPLLPGNYYQIYNRANAGANLFREESDYRRFLRLYVKHISPVAETYAWVLMPNHFHWLIGVKEGVVYKYSKEDFINKETPSGPADADGFSDVDGLAFDEVKWETVHLSEVELGGEKDSSAAKPVRSGSFKEYKRINDGKIPNATRHVGHLCNAYSKYFNEKYERTGSLFQRQYKRKLIDNEEYFRQVILYIHKNPVHHGFAENPDEYLWSSYHAFISSKSTQLRREEVLSRFQGHGDFKERHEAFGDSDFMMVEAWLEED